MATTWTLFLAGLATVQAASVDSFQKLGNTSKVACRTEDGNTSEIGAAYWQATSIETLEKCATLCLEMLSNCQGIEYEEMGAGHGRCEIWTQKVKGSDISFQNNISCHSLSGTRSGNEIAKHFVSWHVKIQGLSNETFNISTKEAMTSAFKSKVAEHLSSLNSRPNINLTLEDVELLIQSCDKVVIIITRPKGTNLAPIYEALSWHSSDDNPNQGSKKEALLTELETALAPLNISLDDDDEFDRMIDNIGKQPTVSIPSTCVLGKNGNKDSKLDAAGVQRERAGKLVAMIVTASLSLQ